MKLNNVENNALPRIERIFFQLYRGEYCSIIDLLQAYAQLEADKRNLTFTCIEHRSLSCKLNAGWNSVRNFLV